MTLEEAERFQAEAERAGRIDAIAQRLEYLRSQIQAECISYSELAELQALADEIEPGDTELLEWAGVPEGRALPCIVCTAEGTEPHTEECLAQRIEAQEGWRDEAELEAVQSLDDRSLPTFSELTEEGSSLLLHPDGGKCPNPAECDFLPADDETRWHVGCNIPGYLPESEPYHVTGWKNAAEALADEIERSLEFLADGEAEAQILDEYTEALEELKALTEEMKALTKAGEPVELGWVLPTSDSKHDLGLSFWVVQCLEDDCTEENEEGW